MGGTRAGGLQAYKTNTERHGADHYKRIGHKGGSVKGVKKGFALMTLAQRRAAGKKGGLIGGKISRRVYK